MTRAAHAVDMSSVHESTSSLRGAPPSLQRLALILVACFAAQLALYHLAFFVQPSADDYILAGQVRLGERLGPLTFLTSSPLNDYRPLQSMVYWAAGRWSAENPFPLIHILNFLGFAFYALVFALWLNLCRLPTVGVLSAAILIFFHPVMVGPLADLDGFARPVVSGWVWLGAYCAFRYADRLPVAISLTSLCLLIGLGFLEYAVAVVPLSVLALWFGRTTGRQFRAVLTLFVVLLAVFAAYYLLRMSVIGQDAARLSMNPLQWATNAALLGVAVLFMGDTVSVYTERSAPLLITAGVSVLATIAVLLGGLGLWHAARRTRGRPESPAAPGNRVVAFLAIGSVVSFAPMVFMEHVSEIYATAIVFPVALLTGVAVTAWAGAERRYFISCLVILSAQAVWACTSVNAKVNRLRDTGDRAGVQMQSLLGWIPPAARDRRVALIFLESELPPRRTYSVFQGGDDHLIQPGASARAAIEWFRPGRNIQLTHLIVKDKSTAPVDGFDLLLYWNPVTRRFESWSV